MFNVYAVPCLWMCVFLFVVIFLYLHNMLNEEYVLCAMYIETKANLTFALILHQFLSYSPPLSLTSFRSFARILFSHISIHDRGVYIETCDSNIQIALFDSTHLRHFKAIPIIISWIAWIAKIDTDSQLTLCVMHLCGNCCYYWFIELSNFCHVVFIVARKYTTICLTVLNWSACVCLVVYGP